MVRLLSGAILLLLLVVVLLVVDASTSVPLRTK
jgi:hypothetical protein